MENLRVANLTWTGVVLAIAVLSVTGTIASDGFRSGRVAPGIASPPQSSLVASSPARAQGRHAGSAIQPDTDAVVVAEDGATPGSISLTASVSGNLCPPHAWTFYSSTTGTNGPWTAYPVDASSADSVS